MIPPPPWLQPEEAYLVGISGGRDSIALHHWLVSHGFENLTYCHLNHGLRGEESDGDETFLQNLLGSSLLSKKCDVAALASNRKLSLETAAREARHHFFNECAGKTGVTRILLAHHADDQVETILFNLFRGSAGIKGMNEQQKIGNITLLRPLLGVRRSAIDSFLAQNQYSFRDDSSNLAPFATRNRIRNEVLPLVTEIMERDPVTGILRARQSCAELEEIADSALDFPRLLDPQGRIHLPTFRSLARPLQKRALHRYLTLNEIGDLTSDLIDRALEITEPHSAPSINLPGSRRLRRKESRLFISS